MKQDILKEINTAFDHVSEAEWLAKIEMDLKGKPLSSLDWKLNEELTFSPIYTKEDIKGFDTKVLKNSNPDWQIGEHYHVGSAKETNAILLKDLMHGLNAPVFTFKNKPTVEDFTKLFDGVGLEHIFIHFTAGDVATKDAFISYLATQNINGHDLNYFFKHEETHVNATLFYADKTTVKEELDKTINAAKQLFETTKDKKALAKNLRFTFYVDKSYLLSIAKLRAFKLRYVELLKSIGVERQLPFIYAVFSPAAYGEDEQDNLINATSLAMSAVLGGANHLIVRPTADTASAKRLARNVQLILKHESGLHKVADPANGSYYIENLTGKLVGFCK